MGKKKNKKVKKTVQPPKKATDTVRAIYEQPQQGQPSEKYVARRKRDIERDRIRQEEELAAAEAARATAEKAAREEAERQAEKFAETDNSVFFVSVEEGSVSDANSEKKAKKRVKREKPVREKKEKSPKPPKQRKQKKVPTLSARADTENPQAIAEYMEKVSRIEEWNKRFNAVFFRVAAVLAAAAFIFIILWNIEIARISVEGRGTYEIGVNIFGMTSSVRETDTAALISEEKVRPGSAGFIVFRIIDDMYIGTGALRPYDLNKPVLIGVYGPKIYTGIFEQSDFSLGRADMQVRRAVREDKRYAKRYGMTLGRSTLIREYTEKYGGELESNLDSLREAEIMKIINRETVTDEASKVIEDIFSGSGFTSGSDIPVIITDNSTPAPETAQPTAAPAAKTKQQTSSSGNQSVGKKHTSSSGGSVRSKSSGGGDDDDDAPTPAPSSGADKTTEKATAKPSVTVKPLAPIREVARPTANPTVAED